MAYTLVTVNYTMYLAKLSSLLENLPPDQEPPDLAGAGADLVELGVAQQAPGRKLVDVAVAAQELDGVERDLGGLLRREQDRARRVLARGLAAVAGLGDGIDVGARRVQRHIHVGDLRLHELEAADRLAELLALVHVGDRNVEARLHDAERSRRQHRALVVEARHQYLHALAHLAD